MKKRSNRNKWHGQHGVYTSDQVDRKIREAQRAVMIKQLMEHGYGFCTRCGVNSSHTIIDPAHKVSVKECKESGQVERAWEQANIIPLCRGCHKKHDKLNLQWTQQKNSLTM